MPLRKELSYQSFNGAATDLSRKGERANPDATYDEMLQWGRD